MSTRRTFVLGSVFLLSLAGCEKTSAPPPEAATAPAETTAPATSATSPVVETTPSTGAPEPGPTAASAPVVPLAEPAPSDSASGNGAAVHHGNPREHAEAAAAPASGGPTGDDACQSMNFHYTQIASACKSGGRKAVKAIMKGVVKKAKAAGTDLQCTSCHEDMKDFHLKSNAVGDLKNWL